MALALALIVAVGGRCGGLPELHLLLLFLVLHFACAGEEASNKHHSACLRDVVGEAGVIKDPHQILFQAPDGFCGARRQTPSYIMYETCHVFRAHIVISNEEA